MAIKRYVGMGKETTYGTAVAATRYVEAIASIKPNQGWIIPTPIAQREYRKKILGPYRARGNIGAFDVEPENAIGDILLGLIGGVSTSNPQGSVFLHEFIPVDMLPSYTVRIGAEITERVLPGCLVNSLLLRGAHGENVKATAEILSGFLETKTSLATPTISPLQAFNPYTDPVNNYIKIATVDKKTYVYDWEIKIDNKIPFERGALDGRTFSTKRVGTRKITGKLSLFFDETAEYDRFIAGTEFAFDLVHYGPIISGAYKYYLLIKLGKCVYTGGVPEIVPQDEPLAIPDASFEAFYDTTLGSDIRILLENTISSY